MVAGYLGSLGILVADIGIGFFEGFKGGDTVLVACSDDGLRRLRDLLASSPGGLLPLHQFGEVAPNHPAQLFVAPAQVHEDGFVWSVSLNDAVRVHDALSSLAQSGHGHRYFELANSDAQLVVSLNEYDASWWLSNA